MPKKLLGIPIDAEALKSAIQKRGSIASLEEPLAVTRQAINGWLSSSRIPPRKLHTIAKSLKLSPDEIDSIVSKVSRGGKVIERTRSNKPIYEGSSHAQHMRDREATKYGEIVPAAKNDEQHKDYSVEDHMDAMHHHEESKKKSSGKTSENHERASLYHDDKIIEHFKDKKPTPEDKLNFLDSKAHYREKFGMESRKPWENPNMDKPRHALIAEGVDHKGKEIYSNKIGSEKPTSPEADPFRWSDIKHGETKRILQEHKKHGKPVEVHTSSDLAGHDDYMEHLPKGSTINFHSQQAAGHGTDENKNITDYMTPGFASDERLKAAGDKLSAAGHKVNYHGFQEHEKGERPRRAKTMNV